MYPAPDTDHSRPHHRLDLQTTFIVNINTEDRHIHPSSSRRRRSGADRSQWRGRAQCNESLRVTTPERATNTSAFIAPAETEPETETFANTDEGEVADPDLRTSHSGVSAVDGDSDAQSRHMDLKR